MPVDRLISLHEAIAGDATLKTYPEETRKHFVTVIKSLIDDALTLALNLAHGRMDEWLKKTLDHPVEVITVVTTGATIICTMADMIVAAV